MTGEDGEIMLNPPISLHMSISPFVYLCLVSGVLCLVTGDKESADGSTR